MVASQRRGTPWALGIAASLACNAIEQGDGARAQRWVARALADDATEQTWQLRISGGAEQTTLLTALQALGAADVSLLLQDDSLEV